MQSSCDSSFPLYKEDNEINLHRATVGDLGGEVLQKLQRQKYCVLRHKVCSRNLRVVGFREIAACSRIFGQNTKFLIILSTTTGRCFATVNVSSILEFHSWNASSITNLGAAQWAHKTASEPCCLTATCPTWYGMVRHLHTTQYSTQMCIMLLPLLGNTGPDL